MKNILTAIIAGLFIFLVGCSDDDDNYDDSGIKIIMPLNIGNSWSYKFVRYSSQGTPLDSSTLDLTIYNDTVIENVTWYITTDEHPYKINSLVAHKDDGLWFYGASPYLAIKYPADVYDTWTIPATNHTYTLIAKEVGVSVPEGIFSCYKYRERSTENDDSTFLFYAPAYGLIKSRYWPDNGTGEEHVTELTDMILIR